MKTSEKVGTYERNEPIFSTLDQLDKIMQEVFPVGKLLLLANQDAPVSLIRSLSYKIITFFEPTDGVELFALGDGISGVIGFGTKQIPMARYVSSVLSVPCIVIPDVIDKSVFLEKVKLVVGGKNVSYFAPPPIVFVDETYLKGEEIAYARIASYEISLFEEIVKRDYRGEDSSSLLKEVASTIESVKWYDKSKKSVFLADWNLNLPRGTVEKLGKLLGNDLLALEKLTKAYLLFFEKGYLRPYAIGENLKEKRDLFLRFRKKHFDLIREIDASLPMQKRIYFSLGGTNAVGDGKAVLGILRTLAKETDGVLSLMNDFALLEEPCKRRYRK